VGALPSFAAVLAVYAVAAHLAVTRGTGTDSDYLTAGRSAGRMLVGLSAGAASASGFIMTGAVGAGYAIGLSALFMPLSWFAGDLLFWSLFPARIHRLAKRHGCETVPALLGAAVPDPARISVRAVAALCIVVFVGLYAAGQLLAAGKTLNAVSGMPQDWAILTAALIVILYCARGGLRASMWTNALQAVVMISIACGALAFAVMDCGGWGAMLERLAVAHPSLLDPLGVAGTWPLLALFAAGFAGAALGFDLSTPQLLVRVMAGRDDREAAAARWYYLGFMQLTWCAMTLFGVAARVLLPDLGDPEQALPLYALANLPPWITGLVMAGIFSAIASTLEGQFLVLSSSVAVDIAPALRARLPGRQLDAAATAAVGLVLGVLTMGVAATVFDLIIFAANALSAAFAPVMLILLTGSRATPASLKWAMTVGVLVAVAWRWAGWDRMLLEALPGIVAGLAAHRIVLLAGARGMLRRRDAADSAAVD
jgi:sodium/proline symporter